MLGVVGTGLPRDCETAERARETEKQYDLVWSGHVLDDIHFNDLGLYQRLVRTPGVSRVRVAAIRVRYRAYMFGLQCAYRVQYLPGRGPSSRQACSTSPNLSCGTSGPAGSSPCPLTCDWEEHTAPEHFYEKGFFAYNSYGAEYTGLFDETIKLDAEGGEIMTGLDVVQAEPVVAIILQTNRRKIRLGGGNAPNAKLVSLSPASRRSEIIGFAGSAYGVLHRVGVWYRPRWLEIREIVMLKALLEVNRARLKSEDSIFDPGLNGMPRTRFISMSSASSDEDESENYPSQCSKDMSPLRADSMDFTLIDPSTYEVAKMVAFLPGSIMRDVICFL